MCGVDLVTLDSVYFENESRVQCLARAVDMKGRKGREMASEVLTIKSSGREKRFCPGDTPQPFTTRITYLTGAEKREVPSNLVLELLIPHLDGMIPRIQNKDDPCLQWAESENRTVEGEPYQFDWRIRGTETVNFYRHLDLEKCLWRFYWFIHVSYTSECHLHFLENENYNEIVKPVNVSCTFPSKVDSPAYNFSQNAKMKFSLSPRSSRVKSGARKGKILGGELEVLKTHVQDTGQVQIHFRTLPLFDGIFVLQHPNSRHNSHVIAMDSEKYLELSLLKTEPPHQYWRFTAPSFLESGSGEYQVHLIPCLKKGEEGKGEEVCRPKNPIQLPIELRPIPLSNQVPDRYGLGTSLRIVRDLSRWYTDKDPPELPQGFLHESFAVTNCDNAFKRVTGTLLLGGEVYGLVIPTEREKRHRNSSHTLQVEKCFLCHGKDNSFPVFDPSKDLFGCLLPYPHIQRFIIFDAENGGDLWFLQCVFSKARSQKDFASLNEVNMVSHLGNSGLGTSMGMLIFTDRQTETQEPVEISHLSSSPVVFIVIASAICLLLVIAIASSIAYCASKSKEDLSVAPVTVTVATPFGNSRVDATSFPQMYAEAAEMKSSKCLPSFCEQAYDIWHMTFTCCKVHTLLLWGNVGGLSDLLLCCLEEECSSLRVAKYASTAPIITPTPRGMSKRSRDVFIVLVQFRSVRVIWIKRQINTLLTSP
ncbi:unnamed protein product, partial [Darwinula stevensoni]